MLQEAPVVFGLEQGDGRNALTTIEEATVGVENYRRGILDGDQ